MITEQDREKAQIEQIENGIRLCEEVLAKAEKYERLKENKDWQEYLNDLKILVDLHDREIRLGVTMIPDAPNSAYIKTDDFGKPSVVSSRADWADFIARHEVQRMELSNWIKEPDRILAMASMAREKIPVLKEKLKEISRVETVAVKGNGAS